MDNDSFETVSLGDYFGVVWRRKWIVLLVTTLFGIAGFLYSMHQQKLYASTTSVVNTAPSSSPSSGSKGSNAGTWGASQVDVANTHKFASRVLSSLNLPKTYNAQTLLDETTIAATSPSGNGVQFTTTDASPVTARLIANGFATQYPYYLRYIDPTSSLNVDKASLVKLMEKIHNPSQYLPSKGQTAFLQRKQWKSNEAKLTGNIQNDNSADPELEMSASSNPTGTASETQPKTSRNVAIAAFIGFVVGVMLAFLQDVLDTRVRSADEIGRRLRLPLLAQIPTPPRHLDGELVMLADPTPAITPSTEAYRIAKLNFTNTLDTTSARIIMFTSASEQDGTSPTLANLALVLAQSGQHVILLDANLRDPVQADQFGLHAPIGLGDVLSGSAKLADVLTAVDIRPHGINSRIPTDGILEIVPAGGTPYDPAALLDTRAAGELLRALSGRADIVLVDTPPILLVSDAMVLASKVDGVVLITRAGRDSRDAVVSLREALDNCPTLGLAFVFTGAATQGHKPAYGKSYRQDPRPSTRPAPPDDERDPRAPREIGAM